MCRPRELIQAMIRRLLVDRIRFWDSACGILAHSWCQAAINWCKLPLCISVLETASKFVPCMHVLLDSCLVKTLPVHHLLV